MSGFLSVIDMALFDNLPHKKEEGKETYNEVYQNIIESFDEFERYLYKDVDFDEYGVICLRYKDNKTSTTIWIDEDNVSKGYFVVDEPNLFRYIINNKYKEFKKVVTINETRKKWQEYKPKLHYLVNLVESDERDVVDLFVTELMFKLSNKYENEEWFKKLKKLYSEYKFENA